MARHAPDPVVVRQPYQKFDVFVRKSEIDGHGVFAAEMIPPRLKIGEIRAEPISCAEGRRRAASLQRIMIVEISPRTAIDASKSTDPMRFTNHSCQANARLAIIAGRIEFYALRGIEPGEEIALNDGQTTPEAKLRCRCGAPNCIGNL